MDYNALAWMFVQASVIIGAGVIVGQWLAGLARQALSRTRLDASIRRLLGDLVRPAVFVVAVLAALHVLGIDTTSLVAVAGAGTLAVGMALRSSLSNVASGAILLTLRPYNEGETVTIAGGVTGTILELELYATKLRTPDGRIITLANDQVLSKPIENFSDNGRRRFDLSVVLRHDADLEQGMVILQQVLDQDERVSDTAVVVDGWTELGQAVIVRGWVDNANFGAAKADAARRMLVALREHQIPVASRSGQSA